MMKTGISCLALFLVGRTTEAFSAAPVVLNSRTGASESTRLFYEEGEVVTYFEDLELAVDCATQFGLCDVDMLHRLADKVDAGADSCIFEVGEELCKKEIEDRKDVAEVLRMQAELQLRMEAIEGSSLFAADVRDERDIRERDDVLEILSEDGM